MREFVVRLTLDTGDDLEWVYQADDALHAWKQYNNDAILDSDTVVEEVHVGLLVPEGDDDYDAIRRRMKGL